MTRFLPVAFAAFALFLVSLFGYAMTVGPNDIQKNAVRSKHIKNGQVKSKDIKNDTVKGKDIRDGTIKTKDLANEAVNATKIESGAVGATELNPSVRPGGTLPSGITLRGLFGMHTLSPDTADRRESHPVSFGGYQLPARPTVHVIGVAGSSTADCPGSASAPEANPGHLCLYLTAAININSLDVLDLEGNWITYDVDDPANTSTEGDGKVSAMGFIAIARTFGNSSVGHHAIGAWAVRS